MIMWYNIKKGKRYDRNHIAYHLLDGVPHLVLVVLQLQGGPHGDGILLKQRTGRSIKPTRKKVGFFYP